MMTLDDGRAGKIRIQSAANGAAIFNGIGSLSVPPSLEEEEDEILEILRDIESTVRDRPAILIDDILESGRTVAFAKDLIVARGAAEVKTCVFLDKPGKRAASIDADYLGFSTPDLFVVGYGMDMAHSFRELPYVGVVEV